MTERKVVAVKTEAVVATGKCPMCGKEFTAKFYSVDDAPLGIYRCPCGRYEYSPHS